MNIARYNAGGCSDKSYAGESISYSSNIPDFKKIEGFWIDWGSQDTSSSSWDWSRDKNQLEMVKKAMARGTNFIELFSNSPMWWMCTNHNPSGNTLPILDNL